MSEEKIIDHTEKAIKAVLSKERKWYEKLKEFLFEILIIVIAVSLTLWLHNLNDRRHEDKQERDFLVGIREDLKRDTSSLNKGIAWSNDVLIYYGRVWEQIYSHNIDARYVDANWDNMLNTSYLSFDYSLFESFESSGNLRLIENKNLLKEITHIYADLMPFIENADKEGFGFRHDNFAQYIGRKAQIDSSGVIHVSKLLDDPAVRYQILSDRQFLEERKTHFEALKNNMTDLINEINAEVNKHF